jgi:hypothetical protein
MSELTTVPVKPKNIFAEVITGDVVRDILVKQVEKAREGNTAAAALVLKIATAKRGRNNAPRRNPDAPIAKPAITRGQLLALLNEAPLTAEQIAARTSCSIDSVRQTLDGDKRFVCNTRGLWSLS